MTGDNRGSILTLVGDSMDNSSTFLEPKPHIVNRTSHPIRAMPNLCPFDSYQNKTSIFMTMASSNTPIPVDDGFNEYESAVKRQKSTTSKVWDEMTKLECENKNELKAQCNHCKTIFSAKSSSS
ncbi:hypothetical protein GOBAR_DD16954 [Gossypium barbadense]|nr:hypothetical protein GOBAR_DD16954 [Gossypium barbadense]